MAYLLWAYNKKKSSVNKYARKTNFSICNGAICRKIFSFIFSWNRQITGNYIKYTAQKWQYHPCASDIHLIFNCCWCCCCWWCSAVFRFDKDGRCVAANPATTITTTPPCSNLQNTQANQTTTKKANTRNLNWAWIYGNQNYCNQNLNNISTGFFFAVRIEPFGSSIWNVFVFVCLLWVKK